MARILLIEDDSLFRGMLREALTRVGHEVTEAENGGVGLKTFASGTFDLVLTDLVMPEVEGIETIVKLRKQSPDIRIIAMSGGGRGSAYDYLHIAQQIGANRVLMKPFSTEDLRETVRTLTSPNSDTVGKSSPSRSSSAPATTGSGSH